MERAATWTHEMPTVEDIAKIFMSPSGYFHRPSKLFPKVANGSEMQKWLKGGKDTFAESDVWGDKNPSFKNLEEILDGKKKKVTSHKRKQKNVVVVVQGNGKEKAKAKKAGEGSKKKAGSKKSHQNDDSINLGCTISFFFLLLKLKHEFFLLLCCTFKMCQEYASNSLLCILDSFAYFPKFPCFSMVFCTFSGALTCCFCCIQ